ncbi:MAG: AMP-binding protein [Chloroflexi bacterium]|nr:AMP-binding protein [Chloroflexota bacterium]
MTSAATDRASLAPYPTYPLQHILSETARRLPQKAAIIDGEYVYSYQQLDAYSNRFAAALAKLGVVKGDRVGLLAPNCAEFEIAFFGIVKAGAVVTTINSGYREREIAHQLSSSGAEVLVVHESLHQMAQAARDGAPKLKRMITIESSSRESDSFWGLIERSPATPPPVEIDAKEDLAALPYSSGTTGLSKGVMLTHFNMTANLRQFMVRPGEALQQRESDVLLAHLPLFHIYGMQVLMNAVILSGGTQVMMGRFDMGEMLRLVAAHKITHLYTVPPVGIGLSMLPNLGLEPDFSSMIAACLAAAPASAELQMRVQEVVGFPVFQAYGMTELSPVSNLDYIEPDRITPGSVGPAISDTEERVVDTETRTKDVPVGELGELLVRGPQVMKGYYANEEATRETIDDDGWLHTGDIVRMNEDGCVWIVDRMKELIKYKGFQVPPAELEGLLLEHPAIADAAVVAKPDVESGEVPKAFVVTRQGEEVSGDEVMSFVASKVATFKHIREVEFVDAIPKNPSGKILRRMLTEGEGE